MLSLLFFAFTSEAQLYYPMFGYHHTWYVDNAEPSTTPRSQNDNLQYNIMDASGDTLINNKQYFKARIYHNSYIYPFDTILFFREDTILQQVWILLNDTGKEKLLYDYSLNQGDSIYLDFDFQDSSTIYYTKTGWYHVDSAKTVAIYGGARKALFLSNPNNLYNSLLFRNYPELEWIEQVGSTIMPDYTQHDIDNADAHIWGYWWNFYYILLCSFDDSDKIYHNPVFNYIGYSDSDSCLLSFNSGIMSINTISLDAKLYPNPCTDMLQLTAQLPQTSFAEVEIYNVTGIKIFDLQITPPNVTFQSAINVSQFPPGMYFVRLSTSDAFEMSKFVKY
jgi:hypothetical protein